MLKGSCAHSDHYRLPIRRLGAKQINAPECQMVHNILRVSVDSSSLVSYVLSDDGCFKSIVLPIFVVVEYIDSQYENGSFYHVQWRERGARVVTRRRS
jgi:hypothetical protein